VTQLLLVRHAESSWGEGAASDHDRPLSTRGREAALRMGALIARLGVTPDQMIASTASRTLATAHAVATSSGFRGKILGERSLYLASAAEILRAIRRIVRPDAARLLIVGHNPGSEDLVYRLTGRIEVLPTAALAQIELPIESWQALRISTAGTLIGVWRPKTLSPAVANGENPG
jgi:phosphohistidine phosphatase